MTRIRKRACSKGILHFIRNIALTVLKKYKNGCGIKVWKNGPLRCCMILQVSLSRPPAVNNQLQLEISKCIGTIYKFCIRTIDIHPLR